MKVKSLTFSAVIALAFTSSAVAAPTITLHPGQSKRVGGYTVVCTTKAITRTAIRVVLHVGYAVTIKGVRVRCLRLAIVPVPTPTPTPMPAPIVQGTRANPFALGTFAGDATWKLRVNSLTADAWPAIQAENMFNDAPPAGYQDVMANLTATYVGPGTSDITTFDISLGVVGQGGIEYTSFGNSCGVVPPPRNIDYSNFFSGATFGINVCWQVAIADAGSLELLQDGTTWFGFR
jgi:hypothetical protein